MVVKFTVIYSQGPTQQAEAVAARRDAFLSKWRALSGALQAYRERLSAALQLHSFNRYGFNGSGQL